jgi:hypothetical protein
MVVLLSEQAQLIAGGLIEEPDVERLLGFARGKRLRHEMSEALAQRDRPDKGLSNAHIFVAEIAGD